MAILVFFMQYQANGGAPFVNNEIPIAFVLFGIDSSSTLRKVIARKNGRKIYAMIHDFDLSIFLCNSPFSIRDQITCGLCMS